MAKSGTKRHYYSPEFKRDAVQMVDQGDQPLAVVARTLGVKSNMLQRWKQELQVSGGADIQEIHAILLEQNAALTTLARVVFDHRRCALSDDGFRG